MKIINRILRRRGEKFNIKTTVFLICLLISLLIWFLIKLTEQYSTEVQYPVKFINIPEGKILTNKVDSLVKFGIEERGFDLIGLKWFTRKRPFEIDLNKLGLKKQGDKYIACLNTSQWAQEITRKLNVEGNLKYVFPDTIFFRFENRYSKKIPVKSDISVSCKKQYFVYDSVRLNPDSVIITGLKSIIDTISFIKTVSKKYSETDQTVDEKIALSKNFVSKQISLNKEEINIYIPVEKYTESEIEIPVTLKNKKDNLRIKLFPDRVKVFFMIALKDFNKISSENFSCSVDLSEIIENKDKKLRVILDSSPKFCKIIRIEPPEIDCLILR